MYYTSRTEETVTFYLKPKVAKKIIKWSRFMAICSIVSAASACATVVGIPLGVIGIIAAIKLIKSCSDLDSYIITGKLPYSENAGNNFYEYFRRMKAYYIVSLAIMALTVVLCVVLIIIFRDAIFAAFDDLFDFGGLFPDDFGDGDSSLPLLISQIGKFFHRA